MSKITRILLGVIVVTLVCVQAIGATSFVVRQIRIDGLTGISRGTVLNYMPITVGETLTDSKSAEIISSLYSSGFFTNVSLARQGDTLVVRVSERAAIGSIKVTGNKAITKDEIKKLLKGGNLTVGNVYSRASAQSLQQTLQTQYYAMGYYNARVTTEVMPLANNRIGLTVTIFEGKVAKIREIRFIGNEAFSNRELKRQLLVTTPKIWTFITKSDQYSKPKLDASLEKLRSFYMNHGYIHFKVDAAQVSLSPNRENVYIVIRITEGPQYRFGDFTISGRTAVPTGNLVKLVTITPGQVFSQKVIEDSNEAIGFALGDKGYAFARVQAIPTVNERAKTVSISFNITQGPQVYVRRIVFTGNNVTADYVLRRSMVQTEGGLLSARKVRQSIRQLNRLGFFKNVQVKTVPVPGTTNQVDVIYSVEETPAGQVSASLGYGTLGFEIGAGINQPNFLGTGKTVGFNFTRNRYATTYSANYYNPYFTVNNIGRGFSAFYTKTRPGNMNLTNSYTTDTYGISNNYNIPLSLDSNLGLSIGYEHIKMNTLSNIVCGSPLIHDCITQQVATWVKNNGTLFNIVAPDMSYNYSTLDRAIFPTEGFAGSLAAELGLPVLSKHLTYYKFGGDGSYFLPLNHSHSFILKFHGGLAYGNGYGNTKMLPIFFNYYAGGLSQGLVRGFETNTLGPKDSLGNAIGGNELVYYNASLIFPNFISPDTLRTMVFVDAGNVYQSVKNVYNTTDLYSTGAGPIRYTVGLAAKWRSPLGVIEVSLATPIRKRKHDELEAFQFTMGTSF